jgi:hypothetical protein
MINSWQNNTYGVLAMMGRQPDYQQKLFVTGFNLKNRIRNDHPLRKIQEKINFHFISGEVDETYGSNGNVSVPPPIILKMLRVIYGERLEDYEAGGGGDHKIKNCSECLVNLRVIDGWLICCRHLLARG